MSDGRIALLLRVTYAAGARIPPHTDPGTGVWLVERGTIGFTVQQGEAEITRAGAAAGERIAPDTGRVILQAGDTASYGPENVHTSQNTGATPATILIAGVYASEGSLVQPTPS